MNNTSQVDAQLWQIATQKRGTYNVRTEHKNPDGSPRFINRLIHEDSPYLLQHAHNPVNWYAWGEVAFNAAREKNLPIFLSIGYSTCHWCHVMEHESFDNEKIAAYMNQNFICIKVDREQRPDLDDIYMSAVQMFSGQGGWPMSSFLTTEAKPFFGGTYYPPAQFLELMQKVSAAWQQHQPELKADAERVSQQLARMSEQAGKAATLDLALLARTSNELVLQTDTEYGGFSGAPKFPHESQLLFLLDTLRREPQPVLQKAVTLSLHKMAEGGIYDQVGGGFHRYSVDAQWLIPHFEKMLYNQALLSRVYSQAYELTGDRFYQRIASETLDYVLRDMRAADGGFYSATDADSEGAEGLFFSWSIAEIKAALTPQQAALVIDLYSLTEAGNFEGKNILFLQQSVTDYARQENLELDSLLAELRIIKQKLYQLRARRVPPPRDEKIITAWNAMMITALAPAAKALDKSEYLSAAIAAAEYLWQHHQRPNKAGLWRVTLNGKASVPAVQEDYAYFSEALVALYDATADSLWLDRAQKIIDSMQNQFGDSAQGGYFSSPEQTSGPLIARMKALSDGAIPSGNSVAIRVLNQVYLRTGLPQYEAVLNSTLAGFSGRFRGQPLAYTYALLAIAEQLSGESGAQQYLAGGKVVAQLSVGEPKPEATEFILALKIKPGWHINAHQPLEKNLIATSISLQEGSASPKGAITYPEPEIKQLGFQESSVAVLSGNITLKGHYQQHSNNKRLALKLVLQACNDKLCLAPETTILTVRAN